MSQTDRTRKDFLAEHSVRVLDLSKLLEWRGIDPEHIEWTGDIDEDGKLAIDLSEVGARRSAVIECAAEEDSEEEDLDDG